MTDPVTIPDQDTDAVKKMADFILAFVEGSPVGYTVAASRKDLAVRAMLALGRSDDETATVKPAKAV